MKLYKTDRFRRRILLVGGVKVIIDADLAEVLPVVYLYERLPKSLLSGAEINVMSIVIPGCPPATHMTWPVT